MLDLMLNLVSHLGSVRPPAREQIQYLTEAPLLQASKVLFRKCGFRTSNSYTNDHEEVTGDADENLRFERPPISPALGHDFISFIQRNIIEVTLERDEPALEYPQSSKIAAKVLSKLHIGGLGNQNLGTRESERQNDGYGISESKEMIDQPYLANA